MKKAICGWAGLICVVLALSACQQSTEGGLRTRSAGMGAGSASLKATYTDPNIKETWALLQLRPGYQTVRCYRPVCGGNSSNGVIEIEPNPNPAIQPRDVEIMARRFLADFTPGTTVTKANPGNFQGHLSLDMELLKPGTDGVIHQSTRVIIVSNTMITVTSRAATSQRANDNMIQILKGLKIEK